MKVAIIYVFPTVAAATYEPLAKRFAVSYMEHPPGITDHTLYICSNGEPATERQRKLFEPVTCTHWQHNNYGKDIGAFQVAAGNIPCDLMVFLGAPVHFFWAGWLDRIVNVFLQNGPALYGARGFNQPLHHIRTTAFWCQPELLDSYPYLVGDNTRYEFEHGQNSITRYTKSIGMECYMVTKTGCYPYEHWGTRVPDVNIVLDQWSDRFGETQ